MKITAIIAAAGQGSRMGGKGKQFIELEGKPIIGWTISVFEESDPVGEIVLVLNKDDLEMGRELIKSQNFKKVTNVVPGGKERQDSVWNGLRTLKSDTDMVVIHDGARPLVTKELISSSIAEAKVHGAAIVATPLADTVKSSKENGFVLDTLERSNLWSVQTPQTFKYKVIFEAYERAQKIGYHATDDAKLVERLGLPVKIVMGSCENIKITTPEDLDIAKCILKNRAQKKGVRLK